MISLIFTQRENGRHCLVSLSHPLIPVCVCVCVYDRQTDSSQTNRLIDSWIDIETDVELKMGAGRDGVYVRWSIPGLKLVPACSPNGSIDHYSVPFSNQRTATLMRPTQQMIHFTRFSVFSGKNKPSPIPTSQPLTGYSCGHSLVFFPPPNPRFPMMHWHSEDQHYDWPKPRDI